MHATRRQPPIHCTRARTHPRTHARTVRSKESCVSLKMGNRSQSLNTAVVLTCGAHGGRKDVGRWRAVVTVGNEAAMKDDHRGLWEAAREGETRLTD